MADERDVLIYSKRFEGGVRLVSRMLSEMGRRPVLVSDEPEDVNRDHCAAHVVVDWETASLEELVTAVEAAGVVPTAVVNFVESLISWQVRTARHYGLEGGENGREVLLSKARVRAAMTDRGLSTLPFVAGTVSSLDVDAVTSYPVIVKPDQDSGGSRLVRRAKDAVELRSRLKELADSVGPDTDAIVEQYIDGVEFSVDGPALDGRFHPLIEVEKTEHDNLRHHDAGLLISPPPSAHVRQAVRELSERVGALYASLGLGSSWLHVEGRVRADGTCELVEINPAPAAACTGRPPSESAVWTPSTCRYAWRSASAWTAHWPGRPPVAPNCWPCSPSRPTASAPWRAPPPSRSSSGFPGWWTAICSRTSAW